MAFLQNLTRGGQTNIHQLRMIRQVVWLGLWFACLFGIGAFAWNSYRIIPGYAWQMVWEHSVAELNLVTQPPEKQHQVKQMYNPPYGAPYERTSSSIRNDPQIKFTVSRVEYVLWGNFWKSIKIWGFSLGIILLLWALKGWYHRLERHERGNKLIASKKLAHKLRLSNNASDLRIGHLPLVKGKESSHLLITGTTGSGKSNCFNVLLPQIRSRGNKALVVDLTGDYVSRYYRPNQDLILNPFDERTEEWSIWSECTTVSQFDMFAHAMIPPKRNASDNFWDDAGRVLLATALQKLQKRGVTSTKELFRILTEADLSEVQEFFKDTEASSYTTKDAEKTSLSVKANLATQLTVLKHLADTEKPFSIREWIEKEDDQWLFLTARPDQRMTLRPLITAWMDTAINALMTLDPGNSRKLWFVLDELPALQKLTSLQLALAESRKYGGCIVAGIQSVPQISEIYGSNLAQALLDLFNTQIFFRSTDPHTTAWISKVLGEQESSEVQENLSYGANTIRDGVSLSQRSKKQPLVLPTEISNLKDLEAYIKLPGDFPITKLKMKYQVSRPLSPGFILQS